MTHGKVRYSDFAVINGILVCLKLSENYHTGIYYYFTSFVCADITEGFFVFCLVLALL